MRNKRRKGTSAKKIGTIVAVLLIFAVIVGIGLYQLQAQSRPFVKKQAKDYFEILEPTVNDYDYLNPTVDKGGSYENSSTLMVYSISFQLKAIGGDAHSVVVKSWAQAEMYPIVSISQNQQQYVQQDSSRPFGKPIYKNSTTGYFEFTIGITSEEADGDITFALPP